MGLLTDSNRFTYYLAISGIRIGELYYNFIHILFFKIPFSKTCFTSKTVFILCWLKPGMYVVRATEFFASIRFILLTMCTKRKKYGVKILSIYYKIIVVWATVKDLRCYGRANTGSNNVCLMELIMNNINNSKRKNEKKTYHWSWSWNFMKFSKKNIRINSGTGIVFQKLVQFHSMILFIYNEKCLKMASAWNINWKGIAIM